MPKNIPENFNNLIEVIKYFDNEDNCQKYLEKWRWNDVPVCPHCANLKVYRFGDGKRFKCAACRQQFTAKIGTIFEDSKVPLNKWFIAIYLVTAHKNGISSHQLARDITVTQKSAWFMLHRIRFALGLSAETHEELSGTIELDETFVGGKNKNRHKDKKVEKCQGRSFKDKTPVMGMLQKQVVETVVRQHKVIPDLAVTEKIVIQPSFVKCQVVTNTSSSTLQPVINANVAKGSTLVSDEWCGYIGLNSTYDHRIIDHTKKQYVDEQGNTTNTLEGFWTQFKRSYMATYHYMSKKHLQAYSNEIAFRYNTRTMKDGGRVNLTIVNANQPLKYKTLIGK